MEFDLAQTVAALRAELSSAVYAAADSNLQFPVDGVDVELTVVAKQAADARAGVKFWVVDAGSSASLTRERTHRLVLHLGPPTGADGVPVKVLRDRPDKP